MKNMLFVCLIAIGCVATVKAQMPAMQRGVSVQMAETRNAVPMPAADNADAWIVTMTQDGRLFFGAEPVTPENLRGQMIRTAHKRTDKFYVKADARTPFSNVQRVLEIGRGMHFDTEVLLTSQPEEPRPGSIVPPTGLEVWIGRAALGGSVATLVELIGTDGGDAMVKINGDPVSWADVQGTLRRRFEKGDEKLVLVKADGRLPFAFVARAVDLCRSTGAKVALATPEL